MTRDREAKARGPVALARFGDRAVRFAIPEGAPRAGLLAVLQGVPGVEDVILAERVGCVVFSSGDRTGAEREVATVLASPDRWGDEHSLAARMHEIRVVYDGEDLDAVAQAVGKKRDAIVAMHSEREYRVAMLGFLPGFAYLRGLPEELHLPRRTPRPRVPRGSVAIAAQYTGIYPFASPGGWHLLGRAVGFDAFGATGATMAMGDGVRFVPTHDTPPASSPERTVAATPSRPHLEIVRAGVALLVDGGRPGHMHEGMPPGGPLVRSAFARANALAGNSTSACAVELSGSLEVVARGGSVVVADETTRMELSEGERHVVSTAGRERVRYLAVSGGFDAPVVLGSRGTLLVAQIGTMLRKGDRLVPQEKYEIAATSATPEGAPPTSPIFSPSLSSSTPVAIMEGPDVVDGFSIESLTEHAFRVSLASDRTGTRLDGPPLLPTSSSVAMARPSAPMVIGAIELTPSGLIVLGPDHPTTGGYPVVAVVRATSLDVFFSRPIGAEVRFSR